MRRVCRRRAGDRDPRPAGACRGAARPGRDAQTCGAAASSTTAIRITLGAERIRLRGIDAPELSQTCRKDGADYRLRPARPRGAGRADRRAGRSTAAAGSGTATAGCSATCTAGGDGPQPQLVAAGWAVAYGDFEAEERAARAGGRRASGPARSSGRRTGATTHGGMAEGEHDAVGLDRATGCARCFAFWRVPPLYRAIRNGRI